MSHRIYIVITTLLFTLTCHGLDIGNETMADKADRFDHEEFHKEKGIVIWEEKTKQTTYDEKAVPESAAPTTEPAAPVASNRPALIKNTFAKGEELKVREAYKLGNDPALRNIPGRSDAEDNLHQQLNGYCPNGWTKNSEWHKPEQNYFYIHYSAVCL